MKLEELLAKSRPAGDLLRPQSSILLWGHLRDVYVASSRILDATDVAQLRAMGLEPERYLARLRRCVLLAAAIHDIGKANDHFQGMIRGVFDRRDKPQGLRHEWVTVLMLRPLRSWLMAAFAGSETSETDFAIMEWVVAGHHPGYDHASPPRGCPSGAGTDLRVLGGHRQVSDIVRWWKETFALPGDPVQLSDITLSLVGSRNVFADLHQWAKEARKRWDAMSPRDKRFVAAVKDCLVAADVAGSALPREIVDETARWRWISDSFADLPTQADLQAVVDARSNSFAEPNPEQDQFQGRVATSGASVTYVKAGCGTGKTLAAFKWAVRNHPSRRLFFCYPTTGTATEGFRDYLLEPDLRADLLHSRRDVDFDIILTNGADSPDSDRDAVVRLESLEAWATPIVACTVDTILGVIQNNKRGMFAWPALAQSAFVFDEIHAYDDRLFGILLRFLRDLPGLSVLLMTASLPNAREQALRQTLRDRELNRVELDPIFGPSSLEELPRYCKVSGGDGDPLPLIEQTVHAGGKTLWVCNTVGRTMDAARRSEAAGLKPIIYHSRFRYEDRVRRHGAVIDAFRPGAGPTLAICSQVAEMSLDLSADLLVTDLAPVPALIQRLGRLNRRARRRGDSTKPFLVIEVGDAHLPYILADLVAARHWLNRLPDQGISQRHLTHHWEQSAENPPDLVPSAWLDGGPTTTVCELREPSPGISVILNSPEFPDHDRLLRYDRRAQDVRRRARADGRKATSDELKPREDERRLAAVILPMPPPPRGVDWRVWAKHQGIPVVPDDEVTYSDVRGAEWRK